MLADDQVIDRLRKALEEESEGLEPSPALLAEVRRVQRAAAQRSRAEAGLGGRALAALGVAVAVAVALVAVLLIGHRNASAPAHTITVMSPAPQPGPRLPEGTPAGPGTEPAPLSAIPRTVRTVAYAADPHGGLLWGLREFRIGDGQTCVQVGRVADGTIGVLGQDNAWLNDGLFHPIAPNAYTGRECAPEDGDGHAFLNISRHGAIASAAVDWGDNRQSHDCNPGGQGPHSEPPCPRRDLRDLSYGLLGPDAVSIEYVRADGVRVVEPTSGPDGAYLIVLPGSPTPCVFLRTGGHACFSADGETMGPSLLSGTVVAVRYRDGRVCRLPVATAAGVLEASCPPVGYVAPTHSHVTARSVARPITVTLLPYEPSYCNGSAVNGFALCRRGETPLGGTGGERLVDLSFTAAAPANGVTSAYAFQTRNGAAGRRGCGGGEGGASDRAVRRGQRVTFQAQIRVACTGQVTGTVTYTPDTGPGGLPTFGGRVPGTLLVGRFRFRMP